MIEKRLLQLITAVACLLPFIVGGRSVLHGPYWLGHPHDIPRDLDSHFRYISGIFFGLWFGFATCIPVIEARGPRFRLLGGLVIVGGLARLLSLIEVGPPSRGHLLGLAMELGVVPLLLLWQASLARRFRP